MAEGKKLAPVTRVSIDKDVYELYKQLTEKKSRKAETAPFFLMKDLFMWAVGLGVKSGKRKPLSKRQDIFRWGQLSPDIDIPIIQAVGIAETDDVAIIAHEDQLLRIAEEYANSGIRELKNEISQASSKPLWILIGALRSSS